MDFFDTVVTEQANQEVERVLNSCRLSEGELVKRFEKTLEQTFGMKNAVAVNSGTSALHLALILAGVGEGDEVILPAQTFLATAAPIVWLKAAPVFADIGMDGNIDPEDVRKKITKITKKTKAIMAVSWGGNPCDLSKLAGLCIERDVALIQDNAHALGATYEGFGLSNFGFNCYSFQAIKQLTTSDGGLLTCQLKSDYQRAKRLRWFGIDRDNDLPDETGERQFNIEKVENLGFKYHMNDYAAALGLGNLHGFKERQARRKEIAKIYDDRLDGYGFTIPSKKEGCSYWLYDLLVDDRPLSVYLLRTSEMGRTSGTRCLHLSLHPFCLSTHTDLPIFEMSFHLRRSLEGEEGQRL